MIPITSKLIEQILARSNTFAPSEPTPALAAHIKALNEAFDDAHRPDGIPAPMLMPKDIRYWMSQLDQARDEWRQMRAERDTAIAAIDDLKKANATISARFDRLSSICRRLRWVNVGKLAPDHRDTYEALTDLSKFLFAEGIDKALSSKEAQTS